MKFWTFASRSLFHYYRSHIGVVLGVVIGATILTGALMVGDCVKATLKHEALQRLGDTHYTLYHPTRFLRKELADILSQSLNIDVIPSMHVLGVASFNENNRRANQVSVYGVQSNFWQLGEEPPDSFDENSEGLWINQHLADHLQIKTGDTLVLRMEKPSRLSRDAPLSTYEDAQAVLRQEIAGIVDEKQMGRFDLRSNQTAPFLVYIPLSQLQNAIEQKDRVNLMVIPKQKDQAPLSMIHKALEHDWRLEDAQLNLLKYENPQQIELRSKRVFLNEQVQRVVRSALVEENSNVDHPPYHLIGILTYLVNELRSDENTVPYSTVAAIGGMKGTSPFLQPLEDLGKNEIVVNQWLADEMNVKVGDSLEIKYYVFGPMRKLEEVNESFTIKTIIPMDHPLNDPQLMPDYPGIEGRENCRDWDPGFTIDLDKIRPADEAYWDEYRGTPKAFISLAEGQRLWSNRFGNLTAIRFLPTKDGQKILRENVRAVLHSLLTPYMFGFSFQDVREQALQSVQQSMDFGPLFIGFSFFLIVASLILVSLLFLFSIEQRNAQTGLLMAIGFTRGKIRRFYLMEGLLLACIGAIPGCILAIAYNGVLLWGLSTIWSGAVSQIDFQFVVVPQTIAIGFISSIIMATIAIWFGLRKAFHRPIRELLAYSGGYNANQVVSTPFTSNKGLWTFLIAVLLCLITSLFPVKTSMAEAGKFFGIGTFMLIGLIGLCHFLIGRVALQTKHLDLSLTSFGIRNNSRRISRSLAIIGMLACGSFLIVSIGANMRDPFANADQRSSGTGGFEYFGETTMPVLHDLNTEKGRFEYGLSEEDLQGVTIVPIRVRRGDEASCLNMNRAQIPRLLGVDANTMMDMSPFTFVDSKSGLEQSGWKLLHSQLKNGDVPAIADQATIMWALGKSIGGRIPYTSEQGNLFHAQLVGALNNTILQGSLIIDENGFLKRYPNISGYQYFLIDAPQERKQEVAETLTFALQDVGLQLTPATERLATFYQVENTYLSIFQILGGLGLILGCAGIGVIVMRNVFERRGELALLRAVGFSRESISWMILMEHWILLVLGLGIGVIAGIVAVMPHILGQNTQLPYLSLAVTIIAMFVFGLIWITLAGKFALRGPLLEALQNE